MTYQSTRTTTRVVRIGGGPPKVETKTYTYGGDSGSGQADGGMNFGIKSPFGFHKIRIGGDVDGDSCGGTSHTLSCTQRPSVVGRSTRKDKKNPFAGIVNQNYEEIRKTCKEENCLFEDPEFPAEDGSIFFSRRPPRPFEWKRPHEICKNPLFVSSGASRFDVQQGELGDCWLLAAVASLTINQKLLMRVVPHDQDFTTDYCGLFHFFFWHQGQWTEVVVDDRLPTYAGQLVFMHSAEKNEFWSALMEKAYAKLVGSYESLKGGSTSEAMEDFTGGVTEMFDLKKAPANLSEIMLKAHERGSLMGCSIDADENELEARLSNGLVVGHAYSITAVKMMEIKTPRVTGKIAMVRVRNPWGNEAEWKGAWSDKSPEWQFISEQEKRNIGLTFDDDGEFWMSFDDWRKNFQKIEICNLGPDSIDEEDAAKGKKRWEAKDEHGEWIRRVNAGGCRNYLESFWTNPQYRVTLVDPDDDDKEDMCTMLIGLLQKDRRKKRKEGMDMLTIGYVIYKLKDDGSNDGPLDMKFFKFNASVAKSPSFINLREVCGRHKLPPGTYVVVPSTFEPQQEAQFLIRIFTEKKSETVEVDQGTGLIEDQKLPNITQHQPDSSRSENPLPIGFDLMTQEIRNYRPFDPRDLDARFSNLPMPGSMSYDSQSNVTPGAPSYPYYPVPSDPSASCYGGYNSVPASSGTFNPGYNTGTVNYGLNQGYGPAQNNPGYYPGSVNPGYNPGTVNPGYNQGPYNPSYQPNPYNSAAPTYGFSTPAYNPSQYGQTGGADLSQQYLPGSVNPNDYYKQYYPSTQCPPSLSSPGFVNQDNQYRPYDSWQNQSRQQQEHVSQKGMPNQTSNLNELSDSGPGSADMKSTRPPVTDKDKEQSKALKESFRRIAGEDMEVDCYELKDILNTVFTKEFKFEGFNLDTCRSMIAMHDGDLSGKLGFDEFKALWEDLRKWKTIFKDFDKDGSGLLSTFELRAAFGASGFRLSNRVLSSVIMRYSNKEGQIEFGDFVCCAIRLKTMLASHKNMDPQNKGIATFDIDTFIQTTMYS
ncbi:hypothetical protein ACJMK2_037772 [Sinanodonta woodiana]|uniref:Calpain-B n=1 Tax=Sinanodonta woodiana TaxID=1069815 RepID=A0ABD3WLG6_SINWO